MRQPQAGVFLSPCISKLEAQRPPNISPMSTDSLKNLQRSLIEFSNARDWEKFHSPKNLTMALSVEVAELMEHFQWMTEDDSRKLQDQTLAEVKEEVADVLLYLLQICNQLNIDPIEAAQKKLLKNAVKYPAP
jgi:NTP pyrophosphatase (non-canonical NTP hydrolase)